MTYISKYNSIIGELTLVSDGENLTGLFIENQKYFPVDLKEYKIKNDLDIFKKVKEWLDYYFSGKDPKIKISLKFNGTDFRKAIWNLLLDIPYGKVVTYKYISDKYCNKFGKNTISYRAVGSAIGHNPISIIIPCHRVIGSNGKLTGYAGGLDKKKILLKLENIEI